MKKVCRSLTAVVLVLCLFVGVASPTFAADSDESCTCGQEPIVYVAALGSATLYQNAGTPEEKVVFRPQTETYLEMVKELLLPLFRLIITKDYDRFGDSLIASASKVFGPLANAENGLSTADITTKQSLPTDPAHGLDTNYYYGYDFRADPMLTADGLDEYIEHVKVLTGHTKVRLRASSMGGVVTMAYLERYGTQDIKSIIFQCCPIKGTAVAGELYCGKLEVNATALYRYARGGIPSIAEPPADVLLNTLLTVLQNTGAVKGISALASKLIDKLGDRLFDELLIPVFKANCGIWSFVPDEYYIAAKHFMLGDSPNTELNARLDYYHYNVQCKAEEILRSLVENGTPVMILAGDNMQRTPLVTAWENDSDGTVDTMYASVGATVAKLGNTLPQPYSQAVACGHKHLSADNRIDASTCALPEQTWFVKDMMHSNTHKGHMSLYKWFYMNDSVVQTVFSNPDYPQFLENDYKNEKLIATVSK